MGARDQTRAWSIVLLLSLSIIFAVYYVKMIMAINKYFSKLLSKEKFRINVMSLTVMFAFTVRAACSVFSELY
jgi:hypothetical protein